MSKSFTPLPQRHDANGQITTGRIVLWLMLIGTAFWPRLWILGFWLLSDKLGHAFSGWIVPAVGFVILPWTTLLYAWMWSIDSNGVHGWEWITVAAAFVVDVLFWLYGRASLRFDQ
jgi:hypothetical protein